MTPRVTTDMTLKRRTLVSKRPKIEDTPEIAKKLQNHLICEWGSMGAVL